MCHQRESSCLNYNTAQPHLSISFGRLSISASKGINSQHGKYQTKAYNWQRKERKYAAPMQGWDGSMENIVFGLLAGFLATIPMSLVMGLGFYLLPKREQYPLPPQEITSRILQKGGIRQMISNASLKLLTVVAHFGYGATCGAIFALVMIFVHDAYFASGVLFGLTVWAGSYLGLLPALHILRPATQHPKERNVLMIFAHVVWGASLGWIYSSLMKTL